MDAAREGKATGLIGPMEFLRFQPTPVDFLGLTLGKARICDVLPTRLARKARAL
jgi:hypothetical protein